jgi:hypothetical protein
MVAPQTDGVLPHTPMPNRVTPLDDSGEQCGINADEPWSYLIEPTAK